MEAPHAPPDQAETDVRRWLFPRWTNKTPALVLALVTGGAVTAGAALTYYGTDKHFSVGYQPTQPVDYSHKLHAGDMGMDCRYCHVNVERSFVASVPPTQVCMNCHTTVKKDSPLLTPVRDSATTGKPVPWLRVHKVADYVYFDHSRHVTRGVGCVECHGRIDFMERVRQEMPLSMGWCLECHRDPAPHLRPVEMITKMDWEPPEGETRESFGQKIVEREHINPPTDCSRCHR